MIEKLLTEKRNPASMNLDTMETYDILKLMNEEDAKIPLAVRESLKDVERAVEGMVESLKRGGRVFYIGAGTSGRIGILDAVETVPTFGVPEGTFVGIIAGGVEATYRAKESEEDSMENGERDLKNWKPKPEDTVVGISASGRTPYVIGALRLARRIGCFTVSVVNVPNPEMCEYSDVCIKLVTGPEILTGSTRLKAGTAQKMVLNMLSTVSMVRMGKVYQNLMVDVRATNEKLVSRAVNIVSEALNVDRETARRLFERSGGSAKVAIIMGALGLDRDEAERLLKEAGESVRKALEMGK